MSPTDVTSLCAAGKAASDKLGPRATEAVFTWRGERYVAKHTRFRLTIDDTNGNPIAARYE